MVDQRRLHSIKTIRSLGKLQHYSEDWNKLLNKSPNNNVFLTWEWVSTWADVYLENNELLTIIVYEGEEIAAIAPFWVESIRFSGILQLKVLKFLGSGDVCVDYPDLILKAENVTALAKVIWDHLFGPLRREWDIFEYYEVPNNSPVLDAFCKLSDIDSRCIKRELIDYSICPYISLPESWNEYLQNFSQKGRYSINFSKKRLEQQGKMVLRFCEDANDLPGEMQKLITLKRKSVTGAGEQGNFATQEFERFHHHIARKFLEKGLLFLCSIQISGKHVGSFYGFKYNNTLYNYMISVERGIYKRVSIGRALLAYCIEEAIKNNYREFDFLRGDENYKYDWTKLDRRNLSQRIYNRKVKAFIFLLQHFTYYYIKQLVKALLRERVVLLKQMIKRK
jgi:CelD/BcsL family acetyltransferase involved in cellulose biosynthesis